MKMSPVSLYYVHDPMCSWCWAFRPVWQQLRQQMPTTVRIYYLLGGLAADTDEPMPTRMQQDIRQHWRVIQQRLPETMFNFDFWTQCKPRRSTYSACRAVIAARKQGLQYEDAMLLAIQTAYYLEARNPSDNSTLIALAVQLNLNVDQFRRDLNAPETQQQLLQDIRFSQQIGGHGFPSLILDIDGVRHPIRIDYQHVDHMLGLIKELC